MRRDRVSVSPVVFELYSVRNMSDHNDFKQFLNSLQKTLDTVTSILYHVKLKIRVEQELDNHGDQVKTEFSASSETKALPVVAGQGGPEPHVQGTSTERSRSQKAAEKVQVTGGRMSHGK